ncbi:Cytoplasmic dynein light chain 2 [Fasciolopsis buskii]|uniref:Dynein light chain n=1 Tax=Fasciolopsis buskii TaxID=27845 RepID=A0A8E0RZS4_9TREM|nr:Cytoplasmic dynein light chain 2 [Fasciolopsis buski]
MAMRTRAVIQNKDMTSELQEDAIETAAMALEKYQVEKDIASFIKREFDRKHEPCWHCVVGKAFGSCVMYENQSFIYFYLDGRAIMLYKCG